MHQVADAVHVEDDGVLAVGVDHTLQLADHHSTQGANKVICSGFATKTPLPCGRVWRGRAEPGEWWLIKKPSPAFASLRQPLRQGERGRSRRHLEYDALPVMRMRHSDGKRVGGI